MKIAITGGTGFVGSHTANLLANRGHQVKLISRGIDKRDVEIRNLRNSEFFPVGIDSEHRLAHIFDGCDAVVHCAGINREIGNQTFGKVHVEGTKNVVIAAERAGVKKLVLLSFLRARPDCGSKYHESKWEAEEIVKNSKLDYAVLKCGVIYGIGDHMIDHLSHALNTFPFFPLVGLRERRIAPMAVEDVADLILKIVESEIALKKTYFVIGPEKISCREAIVRVAKSINKNPFFLKFPVSAHYILAFFFEKMMKIPLVSKAQVRILSEGIIEPYGEVDELPDSFKPNTRFNSEQIIKVLPELKPFSLSDCKII